MLAVKAVLFDLDGTLVDSLPEIYEGVHRTALEMGLTPPSQQQVGDMIGRGPGVLVDRVCAVLGLDENGCKTFMSGLVKNWSESGGRLITLFPGVLGGLLALRAKGIQTALVTNKLRSLTVEFLEDRDMTALFDTVVAGDDCERNKPAPDMLIRALNELGVSPAEAVMVGDSRNDALAARAAGVTAALVQTGYNEGVGIDEWAREAGFTKIYPGAAKVCELIAGSGRL